MNLMITYKDTTYNDMVGMKTYESYEQYPMFRIGAEMCNYSIW